MNTEYFFCVMLIYMIVNLITDTLTLKTKNIWHLFMAIVIMITCMLNKTLLITIASVSLVLIIWMVMSKMIPVNLGAGDLKMLMIITSFQQIIYQPNNFSFLVLVTFGLYIVLSFIQFIFIKVIKDLKRKEITFFAYRTEGNVIIRPESLPILLTVIILHSF
ncbi:hypothetical protein MKX83_24265 [Cytobacillus sp. FSL M8-0252]|uniref:hypothetical protein n=1 Tax=Cytobacillus sp. FSL M8-0252 TaxID=2921621 RepID=UPI0030F71C7A